jgi:DNA-binding NtrC family response regulator
MIILCSGKPSDAIVARLKENGIHFSPFTGEVSQLDSRSATDFLLVPIGALDEPEWPNLRAQIAGANRLFIAVGTKLSTAQIVNATRDGAQDVLDLADDDERWDEAFEKAEASQKLWLRLYGVAAKSNTGGILLGESQATKSLRQTIERIGPMGATVLILGESGAGKERVAQALHESGGGGPFLALNCAAIPKDLLESELFGSEKGAFSGSLKEKPGLVEQANGGTLFLDEIGEMDVALQPKMLRFLETRKARRVGGTKEYDVQLRLLSATNRNLDEEISKGTFRADLFYRLSEVTLRIPPLNQRREDIPVLAKAFLAGACERFGKHFDRIEPELVAKFQTHSWPGNARELKSAIDRMVILFDGPVLRAQWWEPPAVTSPQAMLPQAMPGNHGLMHQPPTFGATSGFIPSGKKKLEIARKLLEESDNNYSWVSAQLGINVSTLYRWRKSGKVA